MRRFIALSLAALVWLQPTTALAHVTVQPNEATPGSFARFVVRAPNERPDAGTTSIEVQFPPNLIFVNFQPKEGWSRTVTMTTLDEPIEAFGQEFTEVIGTVTWEGGEIAPGEFEEFGFTARVPEDAVSLEFPAVQTYSSGEVVQWTGPEDADTPAARVTLVTLPGGGEQGQLATLADVADAQQSQGIDLGLIGLIVAVIALVVAGVAVRTAGRRPTEPAEPLKEPVSVGAGQGRP